MQGLMMRERLFEWAQQFGRGQALDDAQPDHDAVLEIDALHGETLSDLIEGVGKHRQSSRELRRKLDCLREQSDAFWAGQLFEQGKRGVQCSRSSRGSCTIAACFAQSVPMRTSSEGAVKRPRSWTPETT